MIVIWDYFTKWTEAVATPDHKARTIAEIFLKQFLTKFGVLHVIHTEQGRNFEPHLFAEMCKLLNIEKTRTSVYHPQLDGMEEWLNWTLRAIIVAYATRNPHRWDEQLPLLAMAYQATPHRSTSCSPNRLMLGGEVLKLVDIMIGNLKGHYGSWVSGSSMRLAIWCGV